MGYEKANQPALYKRDWKCFTLYQDLSGKYPKCYARNNREDKWCQDGDDGKRQVLRDKQVVIANLDPIQTKFDIAS